MYLFIAISYTQTASNDTVNESNQNLNYLNFFFHIICATLIF